MERAVVPMPIGRDSAVATGGVGVMDDHLLALWLHGRTPHTLRAYAHDAGRFRAFVDKPLAEVQLGDLQVYADTLAHRAPATQARILSAVKSLLAFGHRLGYLPYDVGRAVRLPTIKFTLAERILAEPELGSPALLMRPVPPLIRRRAFAAAAGRTSRARTSRASVF